MKIMCDQIHEIHNFEFRGDCHEILVAEGEIKVNPITILRRLRLSETAKLDGEPIGDQFGELVAEDESVTKFLSLVKIGRLLDSRIYKDSNDAKVYRQEFVVAVANYFAAGYGLAIAIKPYQEEIDHWRSLVLRHPRREIVQ